MVTTAESFHSLVSDLDYPMFLVTARANGGERAGCLVGFVSQASIKPPRLLVLLSKLNHTYEVAQRSDALMVHFLARDNDDLAVLFGEETGDRVDKFARCTWSDGPYGAPMVPGTRGWAAGAILARWDVGDHVAHLIAVDEASVERRGTQLGFQRTRELSPGHPA